MTALEETMKVLCLLEQCGLSVDEKRSLITRKKLELEKQKPCEILRSIDVDTAIYYLNMAEARL